MKDPTAQSGPSSLLAAIRTVHQLHDLGDAIYSVRSRAVECGEPFDGDSWDHPDVKAYSDAVKVITDAIAGKESPAGARDAVTKAELVLPVLRRSAKEWGNHHCASELRRAIELVEILLPLTGKADGGDAVSFWERFPGWLIDHEEGQILTEELLQRAAADMLASGEAPPTDNLRSCTICGLTVDVSKGHVAPSNDFGMAGRTKPKTATQPAAPGAVEGFDMRAHLLRQREWSMRTFGPGPRTQGVVDHIRKELLEILADPTDISEWIDVVILALDGAWRAGASPLEIIAAIVAKQTKNEGRNWPDWRTADPNKAIEHDRSSETNAAAPGLGEAADVDRLARDLFAAEYERDGIEFLPGEIRKPNSMLTMFEDRAIRAIKAALAAQPAPVVADGKCRWRGALRGDGKCPQCGVIHNEWPCACAAVGSGLAERCGRHDTPAQPVPVDAPIATRHPSHQWLEDGDEQP